MDRNPEMAQTGGWPSQNEMAGSMETSTALMTDRYELTMLEAAIKEGMAERPAVFECFARKLPAGRRWGVVAGLGRILGAIEKFRFTPEQIAYLTECGAIGPETAEWLREWRFSGTIEAYREGELYFPYSPLLTVSGRYGDGLLLETLILSIINHDSAVASAAARMRTAGVGATLLEMGGRRTSEHGAVASARVAWLVGFDATSNLEAGMRWGVPTAGTAAHAFTLAHRSEKEAFEAQIAAQGVGTTLLVDTFDTPTGIRNAVEAARAAGASGPGAIRIDSGDLVEESFAARAQLDALGASTTRIAITGDLDEWKIAQLVEAGAPVDVMGVGTSLVTGSGAPTIGAVYKLVSIETDGAMRSVAKKASGKGSRGGKKKSFRLLDETGAIESEAIVFSESTELVENERVRALTQVWVREGEPVAQADLALDRAHHASVMGTLSPEMLSLEAGPIAARVWGEGAPA